MEVVQNHSKQQAGSAQLVLAVRGEGDKAATTDSVTAKAAGARLLRRRPQGAVAAAAVAGPLPRGSCKVDASVHGPGGGGDGSGGGAAVLLMRRNGAWASSLLPYSVSRVVV